MSPAGGGVGRAFQCAHPFVPRCRHQISAGPAVTSRKENRPLRPTDICRRGCYSVVLDPAQVREWKQQLLSSALRTRVL